MAKYQKYAEYKDSGVEWLGEIPSCWKAIRLKHLILDNLVYGANEAAEDDNPNNPRYIRITDMNSDGSLDPNTFRSLPYHIAQSYLLQDGDILLARSGATVGKSFLFKSEFGTSCFAGYLIRARSNKSKLNPKFAYWFFQSESYWKYVSGSQIQATIQNVSAEKYGDLYLSLPEIQDQGQIANFLDHETAKIDTLITKQGKLIELLKEKRQAVISHAVTKGLNPNAPMKDSGVEWLGEVPGHWTVSLIKYQCKEITDGAHISPELENGEHLFVSIRDIKEGIINFEDALLTSEKSYQYLVHTGCMPFEGDILFSKDGTIGQTAITPPNVDFVVASSLIIIRPKFSKVIPEFLDLL
ncbi:restriction endonuclease subunit S, partial [Acinetobacter johnsonii]|uniref:restriction endonuclease subunit S n=1 Tax=Acinetobacter johnsonii TaxID=40214 RepID=UPI00244950B8